MCRVSLGVEIERADAGRDGPTHLCQTKFSGANGDRNILFSFPVKLTTSRNDNHTQLMPSFAESDCHPTESTPLLSTCPYHTKSGYGKKRRILIDPW